MSDQIKSLVSQLFEDLERVSIAFEESTDTDVREALHQTLNYHFVWGKPIESWPVNYIMESEAGNEAVSGTVRRFLDQAVPLAEAQGIQPGIDRWSMLFNPGGKTASGANYAEFVGWTDELLPPDPPMTLDEFSYEDLAEGVADLTKRMNIEHQEGGGFTATFDWSDLS